MVMNHSSLYLSTCCRFAHCCQDPCGWSRMCVHIKIFYYPSKKKQVCDIFNFLILFIAVLGIILQKKLYLSLTLSIDLRIIARIYVGGADILVHVCTFKKLL